MGGRHLVQGMRSPQQCSFRVSCSRRLEGVGRSRKGRILERPPRQGCQSAMRMTTQDRRGTRAVVVTAAVATESTIHGSRTLEATRVEVATALPIAAVGTTVGIMIPQQAQTGEAQDTI